MKTSKDTSYSVLNFVIKISFVATIFLLLITCAKDGDGLDDQVIRYSLTVAVMPAGSGTATPSSGTFKEGTVVNLQATPSNGYGFKTWTGSIQSTSNPISVTMNSSMNITAEFELLDTDGDGVPDLDDNCPNTPPGENVDSDGCPITPPVYLDQNGITVKCYNWAQVGDTGDIQGFTYTVVDEAMLRGMVANDEDVSKVCTTKVTNMEDLFAYKLTFNQDIRSWDVSNVTNMGSMFVETAFDQDIGLWDVSQVTNMAVMFAESPFDRDIGAWDVSQVTDMSDMFAGTRFHHDISSWDVSSVTDMEWMFEGSEFNQDIGNWDVSNVVNMAYMFSYESYFNQDISAWNVSKVEDMRGMFFYSYFNQDISSWDVSNVQNMTAMFDTAQTFNQDLSSWSVANVVECSRFSDNAPQWVLPKPNFTNCNPN